MILRFVFHSLGVFRPRWLDIGAHHPLRLSNTALFYQHGGRGVNIEPNPLLFREFVRRRPGDVNLNVGVGVARGMLDFYVMDNPELSTFSQSTAEQYQRLQGVSVREVRTVPVATVNEILAEHGRTSPFDLISVDVEGLDTEIVADIDFDRFAPLAICVESVDFATGEKCGDAIAEILLSFGYFLYADTYINSIYFHRERFQTLRRAMTGQEAVKA